MADIITISELKLLMS